MDYNKIIKRRNTSHLLGKEDTIIQNISYNKIFEAELIADKDLIHKETAAMKVFRKKEQLTNPIYRQNQEKIKFVKKIAQKPEINYDKLSRAMFRAIQDNGQQQAEFSLAEEPRLEEPEEIIEEPQEPKILLP